MDICKKDYKYKWNNPSISTTLANVNTINTISSKFNKVEERGSVKVVKLVRGVVY